MKQRTLLPFLLPAILILAGLSIYPTLKAIQLSFYNVNLFKIESNQFIGLENYARLISDTRFVNALKVSLIFWILTVSFSVVIGLILAILLHNHIKGIFLDFVTTIFIMPAVMSRVATSLIWKFMYQPSLGIINYFINSIGLSPLNWLADPNIALFSIVIVDVWQWAPLLALLILTALESLPTQIFEAARVDGASALQMFKSLTFPLLMPTILSVTLLKGVESFRTFDLMYNMTRGGPGTTTETVDLYAYLQGIAFGGEISYASSISIVMLLVTILLFSIITKVYIIWRSRYE
ncbi:MAG: sugar ABC transporter permease [Nitrososphaeria archaeon]